MEVSVSLIGHSFTNDVEILRILNGERPKLYFIGIGGVSMAALAELSVKRGARVFGSDIRDTDSSKRLSSLGVFVSMRHTKTEIYRIKPNLVIYSLAIDDSNPEYRAAKELGIPTVSRAEFMGALMLDYKKRIGVSGSHGKSTTTAMLESAISGAGLSPTVISGAPLPSGSSALIGSSDFLIYEACEYGDSFLHFSPTVGIALNLDMDHTDYFPSLAALKESFSKALSLADTAIVNKDDENLRSIIPTISARVLTFSSEAGADYLIDKISSENGCYAFDLYQRGAKVCSLKLNVPGDFNVYNAAAAIIAAIESGVDAKSAAKSVSAYCGIARRLEYMGNIGECSVFYDYAHHPTEIAATRRTLEGMGYKNICSVFAPHTYTRTKYFFSAFARELAAFSASYITEIYAARESPIVGVSSSALAEAVRACGGDCVSVGSEFDIKEYLSAFDCLVLMGAGDLEKIKEKLNL